jgi:hypothetical protein
LQDLEREVLALRLRHQEFETRKEEYAEMQQKHLDMINYFNHVANEQ